jgi:hypothetical protein
MMIGSPRSAGGFPGNGSAFHRISRHPVLGLTSQGNERLQVVKTERSAVAPHPGLILEWPGECRGEEGALLAGILSDRHLVNGSLSFDPQAAAVGIRGTAGVTGDTGLSCLFGLSRSLGWLIGNP